MGPKRKIIIEERDAPLPPPQPEVVKEGDTPPPMADAISDAVANPIKLDDLEDEAAEEDADLAAAIAAPPTKTNKADPIAILLTTFYETTPYIVKNGIHHELEVRFGTRGIQPINKMDFDAVVQIIKSNGFSATTTESGQYSLRIQNEFIDNRTGRFKVSDNIRTEIYGMNAIQLYCRTNDIQTILKTDRSAVKFTNKHSAYIADNRVPNAVMEDFNFVVSYKIEEDVSPNIYTFMSENWQQFKKHFRYLNRVTFTHPDLPILVDMSIVKTSPKVKRGEAGGAGGYQMHYTTGEAGIFTALESYEIELELDPARIGPGTNFNSVPKILGALKQAIKLVLSGLQHTNYPVAYSEQRRILTQYMRLLHGAASKHDDGKRIYKSAFIGPSSYTLQLPNIVAINENSTQANIRQDFVVTEKADGERHLLYIGTDVEAGRVYLINTNMTVIFTGAKTTNKELFGTLLDGELILRDKNGIWLNLFAAFDIYYLKGADVRALPFIAMDDGGDGNTGVAVTVAKNKKGTTPIVYRHDLLKQAVFAVNMVNVVESMDKINVSPIRLDYKKFYSSGSAGAVIDSTNANEKATNPAIFMACATLLQREKEGVYPYNIDGLIFTHAHFGVGANERNKAGPLKKITWGYSFKWKPPRYNTVDFLVSIVKNENGEDLVRTQFEDGQNVDPSRNLMQYKTVQLRSMYIERIHGYINPCQMIYDGDVPDYSMNMDDEPAADKPTVKQFYPTAPYDPDAGVAFLGLKLDNGGNMQMYTTEGDIIEDNAVVEFAYDFNCNKGWRWVPLRVRHDKSENAYHVANDIWKNIHNPITDEMIATGLNIPEEDVIDADVYYNKTDVKTIYLTNHLKIFHNFLKKVIIEAVAKKGRGLTMIDMACGKAGDLPKWISAKLGFVFGIDLSRDNLENPVDGACTRYLIARKKNKVVPDCLFVQGNSAFNIRNGEALLNDKGAQISRAVFGQGEKSESKLGAGVYRAFGRGASGFNIASMQFALHYMFASERDLTNFARNLAECVALGGYFIATFYDGKTVFNMLRDKQPGEMVSLHEGDKRIWGMVKQYGGEGIAVDKLPDNVSSVGLKINVFQESINQWIVEYLVNFNYFTRVMEEYGFALPVMEEANAMGLPNATGMFDVIYNKLVDNTNRVNHHRKFADDKEAGLLAEIAAMTEAERKISFLNRYCVFKKVRAVEAQKIKIDKLGDYNEFDRGAPPLHLDAVAPIAADIAEAPAPKIRRVVKKKINIAADNAEAPAPLEAEQLVDKTAVVAAIVDDDAKKKAPVRRKKIVIQ